MDSKGKIHYFHKVLHSSLSLSLYLSLYKSAEVAPVQDESSPTCYFFLSLSAPLVCAKESFLCILELSLSVLKSARICVVKIK